MLETAPGERPARKLTEEEWSGPKKHAEDKFKAEHGITDRQAEVFYNEPRTEIKESKKAGSSTLVQPKTKFFNLATHWKMGFFYEIFCQI